VPILRALSSRKLHVDPQSSQACNRTRNFEGVQPSQKGMLMVGSGGGGLVAVPSSRRARREVAHEGCNVSYVAYNELPGRKSHIKR
jgi:hypothetical protein